MTEPPTTDELHAALRTRYPSPEWLVAREVGLSDSRRADAVAFRLWRGGIGNVLYGFEIKRSRADWLRELRNEQKSAPMEAVCCATWVVAPPGVVELGELPLGWGLLEWRTKGGLRLRARVATKEKEPLSRDLVSRLLTAVVHRGPEYAPDRDAAALADTQRALSEARGTIRSQRDRICELEDAIAALGSRDVAQQAAVLAVQYRNDARRMARELRYTLNALDKQMQFRDEVRALVAQLTEHATADRG